MKLLHSPQQRGITLIEALVAIVILALGILGLAAVQARMLVDTRTTNSRAIAIRLIGELSERIQLNFKGAAPPPGDKSAYADGKLPDTPTIPFPDMVQTDADLKCPNQPSPGCTKQNQAKYDIADWRKTVFDALPGGKASIWQISPRQLQVVIAWQANENTNTTLGSTATATDPSRQVATPMQIIGTAAGSQCGNNSTLICHIDFIDIPPDDISPAM